MVISLMGKDKQAIEEEQFGVSGTNGNNLYLPKFIKAFENRPRHVFSEPPGVVHIAIDPSGGGSGSNYTIVSQAWEHGRQVVSFVCVCVSMPSRMPFSWRPPAPSPWRNGGALQA